jgi:ABC-type lipoprotein release transport system permease subunit
MLIYLRLAWRNLWRNKRRTMITLASIFLGVVLCTFITSMQEGSYYQYIRSIVNFYSGYIQVHKQGYWEDKQINNTFAYTAQVHDIIRSHPDVLLQTPRLESFALASQEDLTRGVMAMGIDPETETMITGIAERIKQGSYLQQGDQGVLIGSRLGTYLNLGTGDTLVLISQGYHGASAAGKFPIRGIIKHPSPDFDRQVVYMDIETCRDFFSAPGMATAAVIMIPEKKNAARIQQELGDQLGAAYSLMNWKEMNALLIQQIESDRVTGRIMKGVLYMVIGFGILGTLMMMMAERRREFGVLIANGMQKFRISLVLVTESLLLGFTGGIAGIILSIPVVAWFSHNPIPLSGELAALTEEMGFDPALHFSMTPLVFYEQAIIVFFITMLASLYPLWRIRRMKIISALRA